MTDIRIEQPVEPGSVGVPGAPVALPLPSEFSPPLQMPEFASVADLPRADNQRNCWAMIRDTGSGSRGIAVSDGTSWAVADLEDVIAAGGGVTSHTELTEIGDKTHAEIDTHIADTSLHFKASTIDHLYILNRGSNTHAQIDTHLADTTKHFTEASIDHGNILNHGSNTHAQIDTHLADSTIHIPAWYGDGSDLVPGEYPGQEYYYVPLQETLKWDSVREKWLGELQWDGGGKSGSCGTEYLRRFNGAQMSASLGIRMSQKVCIIGFEAEWDGVNTGSFSVMRTGSTIVTIPYTTTDYLVVRDLDAEFGAVGIMAFYHTQGTGAITSPQVKCLYRTYIPLPAS